MFNVVIAEDEPVYRNGIVQFLDWAELDCRVAASFGDGLSASRYLESGGNADILIADIRMPGMDGLELIRHAHEHRPDTMCIVLTGFADFRYAQAALQLGVIDFVIKAGPLEDLVPAVEKALERLREERRASASVQNLETLVGEYTPIVQRSLINDVINLSLTNPARIHARFEQAGIRLSHYYLALLHIENCQNDRGTPHALTAFTAGVIEDIDHYVFVPRPNTLCLLLNFQGGGIPDEDTLRARIDALINAEKQMLGIEMKAAFSEMKFDPTELPAAYQEAYTLLFDYSGQQAIRFYRAPERRNNADLRTIDEIMRYVDMHHAQNITLGTIAAHFYFNSAYLSRMFKAKTEKNLSGYINEVRIQKSCALLMETNLPLSEIALRIGINSPSYFAALFKKQYGISPIAYRAKVRAFDGPDA